MKINTSPGYASFLEVFLTEEKPLYKQLLVLINHHILSKQAYLYLLKYSPMQAPEKGANTCIGAGSEAFAATITVYSNAPFSSKVFAIPATVEAF